MKKMLKKTVSLLLAVTMIFGSVAVGAAEIDFADIFSFSAEAAATASSEFCGDNLRWNFDESTGVLTISGTGDMTDYSSSSNSPWYTRTGDIKAVNIADGVTSIGAYAFWGCYELTDVNIPGSVLSINESAFMFCEKLTDLTIPYGVTTIGARAFEGSADFKSIILPDSITTIGDHAFSGCNIKYMHIPSSVQNIGVAVFLWNSPKYICSDAEDGYVKTYAQNNNKIFLPCIAHNDTDKFVSGDCGENLVWGLNLTTGVLNIGGIGAMYSYTLPTFFPWYNHASNIKTINVLPGVTVITNGAFQDCINLTDITIPNTVTDFGENVFYNNSYNYPNITNVYYTGNLAEWCMINFANGFSNPNHHSDNFYVDGKLLEGSITFPSNMTSIKKFTFWNCNKITNVILSHNITDIGWSAFNSCTSLTNIIVPNSVMTIDYYAFSNCDNLEYVHIPTSVTHIDSTAFDGTEAYICSATEDCYAKTYADAIGIEFKLCDGHGESTDEIVSGQCGDNLTWVINLTTGDMVISGTGGMWGGYESDSVPWQEYTDCIKTLSVGSGVTGISGYAFRNHPNLTNVTFAENSKLTYISDSAFRNCDNLISVEIPSSVTSLGMGAFYSCGNLTNVVFDENSQLTAIGEDAFAGCQSLSSIEIPSKVTVIGDYAFYDCDILESITIPDSVTTIGDYAFYRCDNLKNVVIGNGVTTIGSHAFAECDKLVSVTIREGASTNIGSYAFYECSSLPSITIPDSVTTIERSAFSHCQKLTKATIGNGVTSIGAYAFYRCDRLENVTIGNSVTSIGNDAFSWCKKLKSVTIGNSVSTIGNYAFYYCESLPSITIPDSVTSIGVAVFSFCNSLASINVDANNQHFSNDEYGVLFNKDKTTLVLYPMGNTRTSYTIPDSVTTINKNAFSNSISLTSVSIGNSVTTVGKYAFSECENLKSVTIGNRLTAISVGMFDYCRSLTGIIIPNSATAIGSTAFYNCTNLEYVHIPANVTSIDPSAFVLVSNAYICSTTEDCYAKTYADENGIEFKVCTEHEETPATSGPCGDNAIWTFNEAEGELIISGIGAIWDMSYDAKPWEYWSSFVVKITVEEGVTAIGEYSLSHTGSGVHYIDGYGLDIFIASSVESIGPGAFEGTCGTEYTTVTFAENSKLQIIGEGAFNRVANLGDIEIPASVVSIGEIAFNTAFYNESNPARITFAENSKLRTVGNYAFYSNPALLSVVFPNGVTTIGDAVFRYCENLEYVHIPASATTIGNEVLPDTPAYICSVTEDCYAKTYADENGIEFKVCDGCGVEKVLTGISVNTKPTKLEYYVGDVLDTTGLTITVTYNNGTTETVSTGFTCTPATLNIAGKPGITVSYGGKTCVFLVTVNEKYTFSEIPDQVYTGNRIYPTFRVYDIDGTRLNAEDYDMAYRSNINVGTAYIDVTGLGDYSDLKITISFKIVPADSSKFVILYAENHDYTGEEITPAVTVMFDDRILNEGRDYTVAYTNNIDVGTGEIIVSGNGNFKGSQTVYFNINAVYTEIVSIDAVNLGEVVENTAFSALGLPKTVTGRTVFNEAVTINVSWNSADYTPSMVGTQNISGVVTVPEGYILADGAKAVATVTVVPDATGIIVTVESVERDLKDIEVLYGTEFSKLPLPSTVKAYTDAGAANIPVVWSSSGYDPYYYTVKDGICTQTVIGRIKAPYGHALAEGLDANISVRLIIVKSKIVGIDTVDMGLMPLDSTFEAIGFPKTVAVTTQTGKKHFLPVTWDKTGFDSSATGVKTVKGTLDIPDGYVLDSSLTNEVTATVTISDKIIGAADIVFLIDTTGSMGDEISNVRRNIKMFSQALNSYGIVLRWALVEYRDITCDGKTSTKIHLNGTENWYLDVASYERAIDSLNINGGGDYEETVIDALEAAQLLDRRENASQFFIVVTDADWKVENQYGVTSMDSEISRLVAKQINTSVVTKTSCYPDYKSLTTRTGGILANIDGNFKDELLKIVDLIYCEIIDLQIESISITQNPDKLSYVQGDRFDGRGMIVTAYYKNGTSREITAYSVSPYGALSISDTKVTVDYRGHTDDVEITVTEPEYPVKSVSLNKSTLNLVLGYSETLIATVYPSNATNKNVSWSSSNPNIAFVDENGVVTANGIGTATVTVTTDDGGFTAECIVTVTAPEVKAEEIDLDKTGIVMFAGDSETIMATVYPETATNKTVVWTSSDSDIAKVTTDGVVTGIKKGTATITAATADGRVKAYCLVTVKDVEVEKIEVKTAPTKLEYYVGDVLDTTGLTITVTYNNGKTETITSEFTCSPTVLNTAGSQTITVTYEGKTCFFDVDVKKNNTVTYYVDKKIYAQYVVKVGQPVPVPAANPIVNDFVFEGWTPTIFDIMPDYNLEYTAVFHNHDYEEKVTIEPTCNKVGVATFICSCGKSYSKTKTPLGHNWGEWVTVTEPTGTAEGTKMRFCDRCGFEEFGRISKLNINFTVEPLHDRTYTGFSITPSVIVRSLSNERLDEYDHFIVEYKNNINVGTATATVTGIGDYSGVVEVNFNIVETDVSDLAYSVIPDMTFTGSEITPDPVVYHDDLLLVKDADYTVEYISNINVGTATIVMTGIDNFIGTQTINFKIKENNTDFIAPVIADQVYTAEEIVPAFNLFDDEGNLLTKDVDYTVEYADNINTGFGKVIITGIGSYSGTITVAFRIFATSIEMATMPDLPDTVYSGEEYEPNFVQYPVIFNSKELVEGVDFVAKVYNGIDTGTVEIIIIGIGNFTGSMTVYVDVNGVDISGEGFKVENIPDVYYSGKPATPGVTVSYNGAILIDGTDYIVEYLNNDRKGVATVVIKGIGNFSGEKRIDFVIRSANLVSFKIIAPSNTLGWDNTMQLTVEHNPIYSSVSKITWSSSDEDIATVDKNGVVRGQGKGNVTITATVVDENGNEVTSQITIKCKMTFWQMIIRFFRRLFGIGSKSMSLAFLLK